MNIWIITAIRGKHVVDFQLGSDPCPNILYVSNYACQRYVQRNLNRPMYKATPTSQYRVRGPIHELTPCRCPPLSSTSFML